jgi:hypothetical protein
MAYALLSTIVIMYSMLSTEVICRHLAMLSKVIVVLFSFQMKWMTKQQTPWYVSLFTCNDELRWLLACLESAAGWAVYIRFVTLHVIIQE